MKFDFYITGPIGVEYDWETGQRGTTKEMVRIFLETHIGQEVNIIVTSPGGYVPEGLTIMELIAAHGKCNMYIVGMTASIATVLCMKAKSVNIMRGSLMLIHNSEQTLDVWTSANKEKIDEIIKDFQKKRDTLDTIDKCLADIYSGKNKKSIEENLELMGKEKWLSAEEAKELGLVDNIFDYEDNKTNAKNIYNAYSNVAGYYGLPSFDGEERKNDNTLLQKIKNLFDKHKEEKTQSTFNHNIMKKDYLNVNSLLKVEGLTDYEDGVALSNEQIQTIDTALAENNKTSDYEDKINSLREEKKQLEDKLKNLQDDFDKFKDEAGEDSNRKPAASLTHSETTVNSKDLFNSVKNLL